MQMKALFIAFEGIEGSGKTHQLALFAEYLSGLGIPLTRTLEPGGTTLGRELRRVLLRTDGAQRSPVAELLLYLADRCQHLKEVIEPALAEGRLVITDRYHDATLAYQGYARGLGIEWTDRLAGYLEIRKPDVTVVIDVPVELGLDRARRRDQGSGSELGRFEAESLEFHEKVREGYQLLAEREKERFVVIDGAGSPDEVFERVKACLLPRIRL